LDDTYIDLGDNDTLKYIVAVYRKKWRVICERRGLYSDDMLQRIYTSILVRQSGDNPYNPLKASQNTWLYKVIGSVCTGTIRSYDRYTESQCLGIADDAALTNNIDWCHEDDEYELEPSYFDDYD